MRAFNYSAIREQKWDSELLGLISAASSFTDDTVMTLAECNGNYDDLEGQAVLQKLITLFPMKSERRRSAVWTDI